MAAKELCTVAPPPLGPPLGPPPPTVMLPAAPLARPAMDINALNNTQFRCPPPFGNRRKKRNEASCNAIQWLQTFKDKKNEDKTWKSAWDEFYTHVKAVLVKYDNAADTSLNMLKETRNDKSKVLKLQETDFDEFIKEIKKADTYKTEFMPWFEPGDGTPDSAAAPAAAQSKETAAQSGNEGKGGNQGKSITKRTAGNKNVTIEMIETNLTLDNLEKYCGQNKCKQDFNIKSPSELDHDLYRVLQAINSSKENTVQKEAKDTIMYAMSGKSKPDGMQDEIARRTEISSLKKEFGKFWKALFPPTQVTNTKTEIVYNDDLMQALIEDPRKLDKNNKSQKQEFDKRWTDLLKQYRPKQLTKEEFDKFKKSAGYALFELHKAIEKLVSAPTAQLRLRILMQDLTPDNAKDLFNQFERNNINLIDAEDNDSGSDDDSQPGGGEWSSSYPDNDPFQGGLNDAEKRALQDAIRRYARHHKVYNKLHNNLQSTTAASLKQSVLEPRLIYAWRLDLAHKACTQHACMQNQILSAKCMRQALDLAEQDLSTLQQHKQYLEALPSHSISNLASTW